MNVDPSAWAFTTRGTKTPAPHFEDGVNWDFYDGYIHVGPEPKEPSSPPARRP